MNQLSFISFTPEGNEFSASLSLSVDSLINIVDDVEEKVKNSTIVYSQAISDLRNILKTREELLSKRKKIPARLMWKFGNIVFELNDQLSELGFVLDDTYLHLSRDLSVKRKWLEKVVILRRYTNNINLIPEDANWGYFEKGTRKKVLALQK